MRICFATHATTYDNERGIASGHQDELSPAGRAQAAALADALRQLHFDIVVCSPLSRARETAEIAFNGRYHGGAPVRLVDHLRPLPRRPGSKATRRLGSALATRPI